MAFEIRLGLKFWFGGQELCNLGQLFEVQFPYLKMEKYKYMSSNVGHVKLDYINYLDQGGDLIGGNYY